MNRSSTNIPNAVRASTIIVNNPTDDTPSAANDLFPGNPRRLSAQRPTPVFDRPLPPNLIGGHMNYGEEQIVGSVAVYAGANVENVGGNRNMPGATNQTVGDTVIHAEPSTTERRNVGYSDNYGIQKIDNITIGKKEDNAEK